MQLLRVCGAQMFSNAVGESNFASLTRFLAPSRLKSGGKLLAAQLLASKASTWAQFKDPSKVAPPKKSGPMDKFMAKRRDAATMALGTVTAWEVVAVEETREDDHVVGSETQAGESQVESQTAVVSTVARDEMEIERQETTATFAREESSHATSSRPQRANGASRYQAILTRIYGVSKASPSSTRNEEPAEEDDSDEEYAE